MILWNERRWTENRFKSLHWDRMMRLWNNVKSEIEFFGYNRIFLHDEFADLTKKEILAIGVICFNYWKKCLKVQFPDYQFYIRFYYYEYDDGEFQSLVAFHKVRFTETLGSTDLIDKPNPAVMFAIV